jgi:hypothetical protein
MLIPSLLNLDQMSLDHGTDQIQFASTETTIVRKLKGLKPELACHPVTANMNVWCLTAVVAESKSGRGPGGLERWHADTDGATAWPQVGVEKKGWEKTYRGFVGRNPRNPRL